MHFLCKNSPGRFISDSMDMSQDSIKEDYDSRSEREKMEMRRDYLDDI